MNLEAILLPLRGVQAVFAVIVFALCAYVSTWFSNEIGASPSDVNFLIFAGVFTIVITLPFIILAPRFLPALANKFTLLGLEAVTMLFWFAGFIALAAGLGYVANIDWCGDDGKNACGAVKAGAAFGAFEWLAFAVTTAITALGAFRSKSAPVGPHAGV
ncbi:hypothetical protein FQN54_007707 [Arachnomyces sp. PD_36]|nr:hypothetical protein FQN54_007707 [Arachnomyces sp. PD_36]